MVEHIRTLQLPQLAAGVIGNEHNNSRFTSGLTIKRHHYGAFLAGLRNGVLLSAALWAGLIAIFLWLAS